MSRYDYIMEAPGRFDFLEVIEKENPYRDMSTGRYTTGPGGSGPIIGSGAGPGSGSYTNAAADLQARIKRGEISTKLDVKKQSKHIKGSKKYNEAIKEGKHPSLLTIDSKQQQALIDQHTKTGDAQRKPDGSIRIRFVHSSPIGVFVSKDGSRQVLTCRGQSHYSKSGAHIVPDIP